jgi:DNA-binding NarL/FixJ family response regulator
VKIVGRSSVTQATESNSANVQQQTLGLPRVLLADDQQEIREAVSHLLESDFEVIATAENGQRALELAPKLSPDVVVLDICMPIVNGIETAERLRDSGSHSTVVFLTMHEDSDFLNVAFSTGALGYVLKSSAGTDLIPAIHQALQGNRFVSPSISPSKVWV